MAVRGNTFGHQFPFGKTFGNRSPSVFKIHRINIHWKPTSKKKFTDDPQNKLQQSEVPYDRFEDASIAALSYAVCVHAKQQLVQIPPHLQIYMAVPCTVVAGTAAVGGGNVTENEKD